MKTECDSCQGRRSGWVRLGDVSILDFDDTNIIKGGVNIVIKSLKDNDINLTIIEEVIKEGVTT